MSLPTSTIDQLGRALWQAECGLLPIDTLSSRYPDLDETDAYEIARQKMKLRGRTTVGYKLGYTSAAMRQQMNIDEPNYGVLSEDMGVAQGSGEVAFDSLIHPLIEPEIAVRLDRQLAGGGHDRQSVLRAGGVCMPALEICDTRYREYVFKAVDNIADNSSSARYVLGAPHPISSVGDFRHIQVELWADGKLLDQGWGSNAMDDPLIAVAWLANRLNRDGAQLNAGDIVLTGGLTRGYRAKRNQMFKASFGALGDVTLYFR